MFYCDCIKRLCCCFIVTMDMALSNLKLEFAPLCLNGDNYMSLANYVLTNLKCEGLENIIYIKVYKAILDMYIDDWIAKKGQFNWRKMVIDTSFIFGKYVWSLVWYYALRKILWNFMELVWYLFEYISHDEKNFHVYYLYAYGMEWYVIMWYVYIDLLMSWAWLYYDMMCEIWYWDLYLGKIWYWDICFWNMKLMILLWWDLSR